MTEKKYKAKQIAISNADGSVEVIDILTKDILSNISKLENTISSGSVSNADTVDNKHAEDFFNIDKTATNFNDAIEEGKYEISNGGSSISNAPSTSYKYYICLVYKLNALICQIAIAVANTPQTYIRYSLDRGSTWSTNSYNNGWYRLWNQSNDGANTNLDADTVDGKHASSFFDTTLTATNFTSATTQGKYTITSNPSDSPNPDDTSTAGWTCLVFYNDIIINGLKSITQIAINNTYNQLMYIRNNKDGTWGSWNCIATTYNLATMQFDATYGNKYNSISDIANEIANGTVNNSNKLDGYYSSDFIKDGKDVYSNFDRIPLISGMFRVSRNNLGPIVDTNNNYYWSCIQCRSGHNDIFMQLAFYRGDNSVNFYPTIYIRGVRGSSGLIPSGNVGEKDSDGNYIGYTSASEWKKIGGDISEANDADTVDGYHASDFFNSSMTATDFNNATETGLYYITGTNNAPDADTSNTTYTIWLCVVFKSDKLTYQLALPLGNTGATYWIPRMFIRNINKYGGSLWHEVWTHESDGSDSGLDADKLDGKHAIDFALANSTDVLTTLPTDTGIYTYRTSDIEGSSYVYSLIVTHINDYYSYIAINANSTDKHRMFFAFTDDLDSVVWNEISSSSTTVSPTIPVVTEDPTSPKDGQMWIRSDLL